jgi:hypothetical protein
MTAEQTAVVRCRGAWEGVRAEVDAAGAWGCDDECAVPAQRGDDRAQAELQPVERVGRKACEGDFQICRHGLESAMDGQPGRRQREDPSPPVGRVWATLDEATGDERLDDTHSCRVCDAKDPGELTHRRHVRADGRGEAEALCLGRRQAERAAA